MKIEKTFIGRRPARAKNPRKQGGGRAKRAACQELFHRHCGQMAVVVLNAVDWAGNPSTSIRDSCKLCLSREGGKPSFAERQVRWIGWRGSAIGPAEFQK